MSSIGEWLKDKVSQFSALSTPKKGLCILGFFVGVQVLLYINQRFNSDKEEQEQVIERNIQNYDTKRVVEQGEYSTIDDQNPLMSRSPEIVSKFIQKVRDDEILKAVLDPQELLEGTILSKQIESYFLMSMGGPFIKQNLDFLEKALKGKRITLEHQKRWIDLWKQTLRECNVDDKDIWEDFKFMSIDEQAE